MDLLTFISNIVASIAWPISLFLVILLLKKEIKEIIPSLQKLKYKDFELGFGKKLESIEQKADNENLPSPPEKLIPIESTNDTINQIINGSPRLVIIEAFSFLENEIRTTSMRLNIAQDKSFGVHKSLKKMQENNIISSGVYSIFNQLRSLKNQAEHELEIEISATEAELYTKQVLRLANAIKSK
jgi:hypothetical protein